ncbi:DUF4423 domain-containing protein [Bdellovibrio bacteriovorus]|nr:DUF4423 domain-containing protein [Bdellovibrio bacteriovorus]AHZ85744.1 hypothetical protein EP01_12465 [Bdellovibrio bacteriovorus]BEV66663.1 hypothetical protein Bb109J_c0083 [Bdellovibrio bacteriovorus]
MTSSAATTKPQLKDYLNVTFFLKDIYAFRKAHEDSFSYESWAFELGFEHRSFLRQVVIGRRALTDTTAAQISQRMFFTEAEREHFMVLYRYSRSRTQPERDLFGKRLMQILKDNYYQTEVEVSEDFLRSPLFPRMQVLLSLGDKAKTVEEMARLLQADVLEVEKGIVILTRLNLAEQVGAGYRATVSSFKVPSSLGNEVLLNYHKNNLQEAISATNLPGHLRRYKSLILAMSQEEFEQFLKNMDAFVKEQLHRFDTSNETESRRLFQVNMNLFSVSTQLD